MAKPNRSLTSITPAAPGEQAFVDLHRSNVLDALRKLRPKNDGITTAGKKVKVFNRKKFHFGNDETKSIEDYDKNQNQNESDVTAQRLLHAHKKAKLRDVYVNGQRVGTTGAKTNKDARFLAHLAGKGGEVEIVKEKDLIEWSSEDARKKAAAKFKDIEDYHTQQMKNKMDLQKWGNDDKADPDRTGQHSFHKALRAFHHRQFIENPQRDDKGMREHGRRIRNWDRLEAKKYEEHKRKRPNTAPTGFSPSGHIGSFNENIELSEVSKALLGRYIKKASTNLANKAYRLANMEVGHRIPFTKRREYDAMKSKAEGRRTGIAKAVDKIVNKEAISEVLSPKASAADYIHDFVHSDDPRFKGKSKQERIRMALGAYYGRHNEGTKEDDDKLIAAFLAKKGITKVPTGKKTYDISNYAWRKAAQDNGKKIGAKEEPEDWQRTTARGWELAQRQKTRNEGEVVPIDSHRGYKPHPLTVDALHYDNSERERIRKMALKKKTFDPKAFPKAVSEKQEADLPWLRKLADKLPNQRDQRKEELRAKIMAKVKQEDALRQAQIDKETK